MPRSQCTAPTAARQDRRARAPSGIALRLRRQLEARRGRLAALPVAATAFRGNIDPAADALLAFLHYRKIQRRVRLQACREKAGEDELVEIVVGELAAAPHHFLDAFGQFAAVKLVLRGIFALDRLERPARLGHRLDADYAFRDLHPQLDRR